MGNAYKDKLIVKAKDILDEMWTDANDYRELGLNETAACKLHEWVAAGDAYAKLLGIPSDELLGMY